MDELTVDGLRVRLHRGGTGAPLLYLHSGLGEAGRTPFVAAVEERFEVLAPELPGFGGSEAPRWHTIDDAVYFLRCLLDALDWPRSAFAGSSLGAWLAAELAVWFPERCSNLVLFDPVGIRVEGEPITDIFMAGRERMVAGLFAQFPDDLEAVLGEALGASDHDLLLHFSKALEATARLGWNPYFYDPRLRGRLAGLDVAATVVRGDADGVITAGYAEAFAATVRGRFVALAGVGHVPVVEAPERAAGVLVDTLTRPTGAAS